ncbi:MULTISPECIES: hypothetical protein [unclassified Bacillus (in: firmicutes)]|uniref:hypothetical protein n=1 Tax=unclassified Bacillus (in: firmicutes) TaxID=185979 RepID=UPI0008E3BA4A|nr:MULTISPECIES: hypothetical protein [unclassified Bacillus (in: firmicutes)]SFB17174.1 hypothetical protein SAMN02799634_107117 [Bacillus sp. UNCCL13]
MLKKLFQRFEKHVETSENHIDQQLQTHYYKAPTKQIFDTLENIFANHPQYKITSSAKEHGEIAIECSDIQAFLVVSTISVKPLESAVDFNITTDRFSLMGNYFPLRSKIIELNKQIGDHHPFIGTGLNGQSK